jgi:signal recognition particle subunit SEC65
MLRPWNPTKAEIKNWLRTKELEFIQKDNKNPRITPQKYLEKYVFTDLHKVFFCDFPHLLQEWIQRLKDNHATNYIQHLEWTLV